jgi:hypothetical protein
METTISFKTDKSKNFFLEKYYRIFVNLNSLDCRCDTEVLFFKQLAILLGCE